MLKKQAKEMYHQLTQTNQLQQTIIEKDKFQSLVVRRIFKTKINV